MLQGAVLSRRGLALCGVLGLSALGSSAAPTNNVALPNIGLILQGRTVYQRYCVFCHGPNGDGRGEMGAVLQPRPRNFRAGLFKFRSTPSGHLPTNEDLMHTVRTGLTGTAMPSFGGLSERDLRTVVEYVKTFSHRWDDPENYARSVPLPAAPAWFQDPKQLAPHAAKGKSLFLTTCAPCHGERGDGRGPNAAALQDALGMPMVPADLRKPLRCGTEPKDIYRVLMTGLDGTPMPSFSSGLTDQERWELAAHVMELQRKGSLNPE